MILFLLEPYILISGLRSNYYKFKQVFDAVAGDLTISEEKLKHVDFSQPYTESGLVLIVPIQSKLPSQVWLFMKPFTTEMWGLIIAITIYNGLTVWLIERNHDDELRSGNVWNQIGAIFWLAFSTLFTLRGKFYSINIIMFY